MNKLSKRTNKLALTTERLSTTSLHVLFLVEIKHVMKSSNVGEMHRERKQRTDLLASEKSDLFKSNV